MPKLIDKEKVLKYLLEQKRDGQGRIYLAMNSYSAVSGITPENFIEQLRVLEHDELIKCSFNGVAAAKSICHVTVEPPALTFFDDKEKNKRKRIFDGWIDFIKFLIPMAVSVGALIVSILSYLK